MQHTNPFILEIKKRFEKRWSKRVEYFDEGFGEGGHYVVTEGGEVRFGGIVWTVGLLRLLNIMQLLKSLGGVIATIWRSGYEGCADELARILKEVDPRSTDPEAINAFSVFSLEVLCRKEIKSELLKKSGDRLRKNIEIKHEEMTKAAQFVTTEMDNLPLVDQGKLEELILSAIKRDLGALMILNETERISKEEGTNEGTPKYVERGKEDYASFPTAY